MERHGEDAIEKNQHDLTYSSRAGGREGPRIGRAKLGRRRTASRRRERRASLRRRTESGGAGCWVRSDGRGAVRGPDRSHMSSDRHADSHPSRRVQRLALCSDYRARSGRKMARARIEAKVVTRARSKVGRRTTRGKIELERARNRDRRRRSEDDTGSGTFGKNHDTRDRCHIGDTASNAGENAAMTVTVPAVSVVVILLRAVLLGADRSV